MKVCREMKLFGVQISVPSENGAGSESTIRKSKSLSNLQAENNAIEPLGYLSDGLVHQSSKSHDRKRGKPWSEDEHRSFLVGLEKLGKGDWKGIANNFVPSRNSSQVASHAQKYFNRLAATERKRRRASVFDIPPPHPHAHAHVNEPSRPPIKADQVLLPASTSSAAASKNVSELKGHPNRTTPTPNSIVTSERPPLSPMKTHGAPDYVLYQPRASSFATQTVTPSVSWVPIVNLSRQSGVFVHESFASFVPRPSIAILHEGSSQAGSAASTTNNDELNLNIRKLTLL